MKAFPAQGNFTEEFNGMDLRDYFAGQVIINGAFSATTNKYDHVTAARAYEIADAMLKARK